MLVIASPGQGAQAPGFLSPWLEVPGVADRLGTWSELAGCDLIAAGTTASADEIADTAITQPLLAAAALVSAEVLCGDLAQARELAGIAAGHSVGELAAGVIAGVISAEDAMRLVGVRGRAMAGAAARQPTGMIALLGGEEAEVLARLEACGLAPANINGAGQIVAAGTCEQLDALTASPPPRSRLRRLKVAGAFHTAHMAPAAAALAEAAATVTVGDPDTVLLSNLDGEAAGSGAEWLERITSQVSSPVRWDLCMRSMTALGATALIELLPGGTLTSIARRAIKGIELAALKTPADLDAARALAARHGGTEPSREGHLPEWRLIVSPAAGTFRAACSTGAILPGAGVVAGTQLGHVEVRSSQHPVSPSCPSTVLEWLVEDGDPVDAGQPLVRLQPEAE